MRSSATGAAALLAGSLLCLTACGGSDGGGSDDSPAKGATSKPAGPGSRLERAALTRTDLKGYAVSDQKPEDWASGRPVTDRTECQPLADATGDSPSTKAKETVRRGVARTADPSKGITVSLNAFSAQDAKAYMKELKAALAACGNGFTTTLKGEKVAYPKLSTRETKTPRPTADEALAYTLTARPQGTAIPLNFTTVRSGSDIVLFCGVDLQKFTAFQVPDEVVDAQLKKLAAATGRG